MAPEELVPGLEEVELGEAVPGEPGPEKPALEEPAPGLGEVAPGLEEADRPLANAVPQLSGQDELR